MRRTTSPRRSPSPRRTIARAAGIAASHVAAPDGPEGPATDALVEAAHVADVAAAGGARAPVADLHSTATALRALATRAAEQAAAWSVTAASLDAGLHDLLHAAQRGRHVRGTSAHAARLQAVGATRDIAAAMASGATRYAALADALATAPVSAPVALADVLATALRAGGAL